ncbi:MAG: hypothetical protein AABZ31_08825 [Bdellovibrionota bacterium]
MILTNKTIELSRSTENRESIVEAPVHTSIPHVQYQVDVLSQFRANLAQLEYLQGRLKFVLQEVSSLVVKK